MERNYHSAFSITLKDHLDEQMQLRKAFATELQSLKDYRDLLLVPISSGKKQYFCSQRRHSDKRIYLGNESSEKVAIIRRVHFLEKAIDMLDYNIDTLSHLFDQYKPVNNQSVNLSLPKTYRNASQTSTSSSEIDDCIQTWRFEMLERKRKNPPAHPEGLVHRTFDGTFVRSKSEVIMADAFAMYNIPFLYEVPHNLSGWTIHVDFTALDIVEMNTVLAEHVGLLNKESYAVTFGRKLHRFACSGYLPGKNLLLSYEDANGNIDASLLHKEIQRIFHIA